MTPQSDLSPEYVAARTVLLDALAAVGEAHRASLVLVGAQAIYLHTGVVDGTGALMTTDSDLALDADLLATSPELVATLEGAGFAAGGQPGSWRGNHGITVDIMSVPHQSGRRPGSRSASLPPHGKQLARITPGLEPSLVDCAPHRVTALAADDGREFSLRVAGPAALLVAKLVKLQERHADAARGARNRVVSKDAIDCYRLLKTVSVADLLAGFARHDEDSAAGPVSRTAREFLAGDHAQGEQGVLHSLLAGQPQLRPIDLDAFAALAEDLLDAL